MADITRVHEAGMIWKTNTHRDHLEDFYREVPGGRDYIQGQPKASDRYSSAELAAQGLVGLYRRPTTPDEAQAAGAEEYARVTGRQKGSLPDRLGDLTPTESPVHAAQHLGRALRPNIKGIRDFSMPDIDDSPRLTDKAQREMDAQSAADKRVWQLLDIIAAEWQSDPMSVQCFDARIVVESIELVKRRKAMGDPFNPLHPDRDPYKAEKTWG